MSGGRTWLAQLADRGASPFGGGRLRGHPAVLFALAIAIGAGTGLGAVAFRYLIIAFTYAFTGQLDYSNVGRASSGWVHGLGFWFIVFVPAIGGLIYGPLIDRFAREARGHGVPEVMYAVSEQGGRIRPQVALVKSVASALCIGSGGSVGREGPIVQIGSSLGSTLGQLVRVPTPQLRVLVACGAAGGISATFNAPIAGVFFALELILRNFEAESFAVVVLSSLVADTIGRAAFGAHPFLATAAFQLHSALEYPFYAGLGVAAAFVGVLFIRFLYGAEDVADRLWHGPEWLRPAAGGMLLGVILLVLPELYGVGYPPLEKAIHGNYTVWFMLVLLAGKILATSLTMAIGGSGGVFAPSLFMGAMLGTAYGDGVHHLLPGLTASPGAYGLVGMGALFAAAARAPITAVIFIFELTGDYRIILPLMLAIVLAAGVSALLSRDTIYTLKLRRRGIDITGARDANPMQVLRVADAMQPLRSAQRADSSLEEPLDDRGPALDVNRSLEEVLDALTRAQTGLPVVSSNGERVGWLTHRDLLQAYNDRLVPASRRAPEGIVQPRGREVRAR